MTIVRWVTDAVLIFQKVMEEVRSLLDAAASAMCASIHSLAPLIPQWHSYFEPRCGACAHCRCEKRPSYESSIVNSPPGILGRLEHLWRSLTKHRNDENSYLIGVAGTETAMQRHWRYIYSSFSLMNASYTFEFVWYTPWFLIGSLSEVRKLWKLISSNFWWIYDRSPMRRTVRKYAYVSEPLNLYIQNSRSGNENGLLRCRK